MISVILGMGMTKAQTFKFEAGNTVITEGMTLEVTGSVDFEDTYGITQYFTMYNLTESEMNVRIDFTRNDLPEGASLMICGFGGCRTDAFVEGKIAAGGIGGTEMDPLDLAYTSDEARTPYTTEVKVTDKTSGETLNFTMRFVPKAPVTTFRFEAGRTVITEGMTLEVTESVDFEDTYGIAQYFTMYNLTESEMNVRIDFTRNDLPEGASLMICGFGGCRTDAFVEGKIAAGGIGGTEMDPLDLAYTSDEARTPYTTEVKVTDKTSGETLLFKIRFVPTDPTANEMLTKATIAAYPNPASGQVRFKLDNVKANTRVLLRDLAGKVVRAMNVKGMDELTMNLNGLASGLYIYSVEENGTGVAVGKLMVR